MDDKPKLNPQGFKEPEVQQMARAGTDRRAKMTPYIPTAFTPAAGEEMNPKQFTVSHGNVQVNDGDWDDDGWPITKDAFALFGAAVIANIPRPEKEGE